MEMDPAAMRQTILQHTEPFPGFPQSVIAPVLQQARIIALGEGQHDTRQFHDTLRELVTWLARPGSRILLLVERPFVFNPSLEAYLKQGDRRSFETICQVSGLGRTLGENDRRLLENLRDASVQSGTEILWQGFDGLHHLDPEGLPGFEWAAPALWQAQVRMQRLRGEGKDEEWARLREEFMFERAREALERYRPDRIVLFAGGIHTRKGDDRGSDQPVIRSLYQRLLDRGPGDGVNLSLRPLAGTHGAVRRGPSNELERYARPIPLLDESMELFKEAVLFLPGDRFLTETRGLTGLGNIFSPDFLSYLRGHDYLLSYRRVEAK